jgi:hypothetical protein
VLQNTSCITKTLHIHKNVLQFRFFCVCHVFFSEADAVFNFKRIEKAANNEVCRCLRQSLLGRSSKINLVVIAPN